MSDLELFKRVRVASVLFLFRISPVLEVSLLLGSLCWLSTACLLLLPLDDKGRQFA